MRIFEAMNLVKSEPGEDAQRVMAVLYAFAEKFMENEANLEKLREVMRMTRLGQMLFDEGLEQGLEQGMERGLEQGLAQGLGLVNRLNEKLIADGRMEEKIKRVPYGSPHKIGLCGEPFYDSGVSCFQARISLRRCWMPASLPELVGR